MNACLIEADGRRGEGEHRVPRVTEVGGGGGDTQMPGWAANPGTTTCLPRSLARAPTSLRWAFGVPLLACPRRSAAKIGLGGLVYIFPTIPLDPDSPTDMLHSLHRTQ